MLLATGILILPPVFWSGQGIWMLFFTRHAVRFTRKVWKFPVSSIWPDKRPDKDIQTWELVLARIGGAVSLLVEVLVLLAVLGL